MASPSACVKSHPNSPYRAETTGRLSITLAAGRPSIGSRLEQGGVEADRESCTPTGIISRQFEYYWLAIGWLVS
jgi:hypothetical protein